MVGVPPALCVGEMLGVRTVYFVGIWCLNSGERCADSVSICCCVRHRELALSDQTALLFSAELL